MTDDNKAFQQENEDFRFDDDTNQFFDETTELSEDVPEEVTTKAQKFKNKFGGFGEKFKSMIPANIKIPEKLKGRRVLIGIVFVVLVIIIYWFIGSGSSSSTGQLANGKIQPATSMPPMSNEKVQQITATGSATKPASFAVSGLNPAEETKPMVMPAPAKPVPPLNIAHEFSVQPQGSMPAPVTGVSKAQLTSALDDLSAKLQVASDKQMEMIGKRVYAQYMELNAQNQTLANQLTSLQQQMAALKAEVATSHTNIKNLQGKVSDIVNGYAGSFNASGDAVYHNVPRPQPAPAPVAVTYVVQAIVPGRAWLYGSNGQTVSVGVGDKIDSYGNVMSIDSLTGAVTMSNGAVLKPGA